MALDVQVVAEQLTLLLTFVAMILLVRGGVVWARERFTDTGSGLTDRAEQVQLGLYAAAGLPIIVAVTELAVDSDLMPEEVAATLIAAGAITVLAFPILARVVAGQAAKRGAPEA